MNVCIITRSYNDCNLEEWVEYHLGLGFKHIFIYDDHSDRLISDRFVDNKQVTTIRLAKRINNNGIFGGKTSAYDHLMKRVWAHSFEYVLDIDTDEYLYLGKYHTIQDMIQEFHCDVIIFNYLIFGNNGLIKLENNSYIKQFTMCNNQLNSWGKTMAKVSKITSKKNPHMFDIQRNCIIKNGLGLRVDNRGPPIPVDGMNLTIENNRVVDAPPCIFHYMIGDTTTWVKNRVFRSRIRNDKPVFLARNRDRLKLDEIVNIIHFNKSTASIDIQNLKARFLKRNHNTVHNFLLQN